MVRIYRLVGRALLRQYSGKILGVCGPTGSQSDVSSSTALPVAALRPRRQRQVGVQQLKSLDNGGLGPAEALPGDSGEAENQHDNFFSDEVRKSLEKKIAVFPHRHMGGQRGSAFDRWALKIPPFRRPVALDGVQALSSMLTAVAARRAYLLNSRGNCSALMSLTLPLRETVIRYERGERSLHFQSV